MSITCSRCKRTFKGDKLNSRHLAKCYPELTPKVDPCLCGHTEKSRTQMKRHQKNCLVWQMRDKKAVALARKKKTSLERYGVEDGSQAPEVRAKRAATNKERYGAENPFSKESSVFDKVQASLDGKRPVLKGEANPFAWDSTKEKIRETMLERHGAENPQQVAEIREKTRATNLERYGVEDTLASPEIRERIKETCEEKYGGPAPSCDPEVQEKAKQTNMERFGVPWTCMDPEVRRKQLETMYANYGGEHFFASDEGKGIVRGALMEKFGVEFPGAIDGHWDKAVAAFKERYGVEHPLQLQEFRDKSYKTNVERHGTPFPGLCLNGPNGFETKIGAMSKKLLFTGDGKFWRWLPKLGHHKNPDFIVPGPDPEKPRKGVTKAVEAFGDFWHSRMFTGKAPFEHEQELIEAFAEVGIKCLVIWEGELKREPDVVQERLLAFLGAT